MKRKILIALTAMTITVLAKSQCADCSPNPDCTSNDGFPTICPESLPAATTGTFYEETITFFMPSEVIDPGSGLTATLSSVTVTSITGVPLGLSVELDEPDAIYEPSNGQTSGCAAICGEPVLAGVYDMVISISAIASAFGIEQVVNESFAYVLVVEAGAGGTGTFSFSPTNGCDSLLANFNASLEGNATQITNYSWDFGNGQTSVLESVEGMFFDQSGDYDVILQTVISDQVLTQITLNSTAGGGWDDGWSPDPDPYFVLSDGNGSNVYTSSTAQESYSATWNGLSIVLTNPPYSISFYDEDFLAGDDDLGSTSFTLNGAGVIDLDANPSYGEATIALQEAINVTDTATVSVNPTPEVGLFWLAADTMSCTNPYLSQYNWMWGDSLVQSGPAFEYAPTENGFYTVVGTSATGCSAASDSLLYCSADASIGIDLISSGDGSPELLTTAPGFEAYLWNANGALSDTLEDIEGHLWFPAESGWYGVTAWDSFGCPWHGDSLLVCWPLTAPVMEEFEYGLLSLTDDYSFYQWFVNGENIPGATDSTLVLNGPGLYAVSVTDFEGCPAVLSNGWTVVDISEPASSSKVEWSVYPNPVGALLQITLPNKGSLGNENWAIEVWDGNGKQVLSVQTKEQQISLDVSRLGRGTYIVQLTSLDFPEAKPQFKRVVRQ